MKKAKVTPSQVMALLRLVLPSWSNPLKIKRIAEPKNPKKPVYIKIKPEILSPAGSIKSLLVRC